MWLQDSLTIIIGVVLCEAIVNLIFNGTVLQPSREFIITRTPFLSVRGEHLLQCKLCTSLWVGLITVVTLQYMDVLVIRLLVLGIVIHRLSNFLHLVFSLMRDRQFDIRVNRRK